MKNTEQIDLFLRWIESKYKIEKYEGNEHFIVLVYTKSDYKFDEVVPELFWRVKIQYHYPEIIILSGGGTYLPNASQYDPKIEFITLKILK